MAEEKTEQAENQTEEKATSQEAAADSQTADAAPESDKAEEKKEQTPEERIAALEKENADLKDQLLRRAADFDNYRKRMMKEKQDTYDYANAGLLGDLLDSLDNFDRTIDAAKDAKDAKSIADGIKMINKALVKMLEDKYGLVGYGKEGDEFNPDEHEAIGRMEDEKAKKETLAQVYLKGYKLKDKVIRHAKVMVKVPKA
ncbi:molecular chaperone GrpE [Treponema bryantii]|uniref:Protein GrpE n=1 Tax=Treponema bryantii TaxID=163 RepID=A0A1H9FSA7_9SPIR|nr:nucleotide exchange factor GrpE [Treponema bryantii]BDC92743.1 protein GrpE [Treponema bryantii]SEQ40393.1 molecular chaperone GrpE [Treponema bryantii]